MGFNVLLCNDDNRYAVECRRPSDDQQQSSTHCTISDGDDVCSSPHLSAESRDKYAFLGRGVQYYLGFHHNDDSCRGRPAIGNGHYINQLIGRRLLGAYYLGCPMTHRMKSAYREILSTLDTHGDETVHVEKENLLLIDPDFSRDYPPENEVTFQAPAGWRALYVQDIPAQEMPLILQRAKIVLDLGMPGVERISGEAILFGCIPVVSERWNGASRVDFPGIHRVDPFNGTQITQTLEHIALHYEEELQARHNAEFLGNSLSLGKKLIHTADVVFGSSRVHFILTADTLSKEHMLTFQVLALLYVYPLCSIDIYVHDVVWFIRHHYLFHDILKSGGYVRIDPLHPTDFSAWRRPSGGQAFVNVRHVKLLRRELSDMMSSQQVTATTTLADNTHIPLLIPSWKPLLVVLRPNVVFRNADVLFEWMNGMERDSVRSVSKSRGEVCDIVRNGSSCVLNGSSQALLVSPHAVLTSHVISEFLDSVSGEDDSQTYGALSLEGKGVMSVCELFQLRSDDQTTERHDVIDGIVRSIPWNTLRLHAEQLEE
eukprot:gene26529-33122_t